MREASNGPFTARSLARIEASMAHGRTFCARARLSRFVSCRMNIRQIEASVRALGQGMHARLYGKEMKTILVSPLSFERVNVSTLGKIVLLIEWLLFALFYRNCPEL